MAKDVLSDIDFQGSTTALEPNLPNEVATKGYVDTINNFPFWDSSNVQDCIPTSAGELPFWDVTNTPSNIPLGCP
jgi:hypothetical protein